MTTPAGQGPQLRPLAIGEILDVAIKIFLSHWRTLLMAALVVVVPVQIVITILTADYAVESFDFTADGSRTPAQTLEELNEYLGGLAVSGILQACAVLLATAACFRAIAQAYLGEPADWRSSLAYAMRRMPQLLLITVLYVAGWVIAAIFFIVPGVWLYVAWAFGVPVLLVEGIRGPTALGRSFALVKGRWWATFAALLLGFVLALVVSTVIQAVFLLGMVADADNDILVLVLSAMAGTVGLAITTPFQAALLAVVYFDLRVRKEGFDLQLLAERIGAAVPAAGGLAPTAAAAGAVTPSAAPVARAAGDERHWPAPRPPAAAPGEERQAPRQPSPPPPPPGWPQPRPDGAGSATRPRAEPPDEPPRRPGVPDG